MSGYLSREHEVIHRLTTSTDLAVRDALLQELECLLVERCHFHERWRWIYDVGEFQCWTETGYDPSLSQGPRDIQLLGAMEYGVSDIQNGGLHQFFGNETGTMAPEMAEWCERNDLPHIADILREAMAIVGDPYPRSQSERRQILTAWINEIGFEKGREAWDPFQSLDSRFYETWESVSFDDAADRWLRDVCGIRSLRQLPPSVVDYGPFSNHFVRAYWNDRATHPDGEPMPLTVDQVLEKILHHTASADLRTFRIQMGNPFGAPLVTTFQREGNAWSVVGFRERGEDLLQGPKAAAVRSRLNRVFGTCRQLLALPTDRPDGMSP